MSELPAISAIPAFPAIPAFSDIPASGIQHVASLCDLAPAATDTVLIVKRPASSSYRRVFVASDLGERSERLVAAGAALAPRGQLAIFHAMDTDGLAALREFDAPPDTVRDYRMKRAARTRAAIEAVALHAASQGRIPPGCDARPFVVFGAAAHAIREGANAARAELVVIGKRRRGLLADYFLGGVTQGVIAGADADVLVVSLADAARTACAVVMDAS